MKNLVVIISLVLTLAACSGETTKETEAGTNSVNEEFPKELMAELEDMEIFEQKSVTKEKDISLIVTGNTEGQFSEEEKITYLANYSNIYTLLEFDTFIARTLLNDYKTMENPTKTFEWVLYADSIFLSYIKQMEFDELNRKTKKFHEGINEILVESINNRRELVQAWLDYTQGKDTKLAIDDIKLNLSEENLYSVSISIGMAFAIFTSENIGTYDVSNYTSYGYKQIELANSSINRILLKYYELVSLPAGITLNDLVKKFKEDENSTVEEDEKFVNSNNEGDVEQQESNNSALDEIPQGALNTVETARTQISYVIAHYLDTYVNGDTSSLEYMVHPSTKFYQSQVNYLDSLNERDITIELVDFSIVSMEPLNKDKYQISVDEIYLIHNPENGSKEINQISKYTVKLIDGEFYITDLAL